MRIGFVAWAALTLACAHSQSPSAAEPNAALALFETYGELLAPYAPRVVIYNDGSIVRAVSLSDQILNYEAGMLNTEQMSEIVYQSEANGFCKLDARYLTSAGTDSAEVVIAVWDRCCHRTAVVGEVGKNRPGFEAEREATPPPFSALFDRLDALSTSKGPWLPSSVLVCLSWTGDDRLPGTRIGWPESFPKLSRGQGDCPFARTEYFASAAGDQFGALQTWASGLRGGAGWIEIDKKLYTVKLDPIFPDEAALRAAAIGTGSMACPSAERAHQ
jgi:hypothetical protein